MGRVASVLENCTHSAFEVITESSSGVHKFLKELAPQEKVTLQRSSSDTGLQHWVKLGSKFVASVTSDELVENGRITLVYEDDKFQKVMIPRVFKSLSMPNRRLQNLLQDGEEGPSHMYSACKPPIVRKSFKRICNFLINRAPEDTLTEQAGHDPATSHPLNHLHSM